MTPRADEAGAGAVGPADARLVGEISRLKRELGPSVVVAAHHYQRPEIVALADYVGDSYKLALESSRAGAEFIVMAGVRFMAESAAILAGEGAQVLIPDTAAGCPMADMIDGTGAQTALDAIAAVCELPVVPVTYMNSYAEVKSFTGAAGGSVCTSSNAPSVVSHYLERGAVFFLPDFNLGRNTAAALGIPESEVFTIGKGGKIQGLGDDPTKGRIFLWDGFCHVHTRFTARDIAAARTAAPDVRVIVHPECARAVVEAADASGSTEAIYRAIKDSPPGSRWAVGTEASFVGRIAAEFRDRAVAPLRVSTCFNMARITLERLEASLASIAAYRSKSGPLLFPIVVSEEHRRNAAEALRAMLGIVEAGS